MTGLPDENATKRRERGLARAGNARVRRGMIQLVWRWLMFQNRSALAQLSPLDGNKPAPRANRCCLKRCLSICDTILLDAERAVRAGLDFVEAGHECRFALAGQSRDQVIASEKPLRPSTTAMRISLTPRALSSLTTLSQNLAPSVCSHLFGLPPRQEPHSNVGHNS
jgi:hypothetical protein